MAGGETKNFGSVGGFGGYVTDVAARGRIVFVAQGSSIHVLDLSDPARTREIGLLRMDAAIRALGIKGIALYVGIAEAADTLKVYDISDPAHPKRAASNLITGKEYLYPLNVDIEVMGDYLYVELQSFYEVFDIREPLEPKKLFGDDLNRGSGFATDGKRLIRAKLIRNDPPKLKPDQVITRGMVRRHYVFSDVNTSKTLFQTKPYWDAQLKFAYRKRTLIADDGTTERAVTSWTEDPNQLWVAEGDGANVITVRNAWVISRMSTDRQNHPNYHVSPKSVPKRDVLTANSCDREDARCVGNVLYAASSPWTRESELSVQRYDLSRPDRVVPLGPLPVEGQYRNPFVVLDSIVAANTTRGLIFFDVSNPHKPVVCGRWDAQAGIRQIKTAGTRGYTITMRGDLNVLDLARPEAPQLLGSRRLEDDNKIGAVEGNRVYTTDAEGKLKIWDCANPTSIALAGSASIPRGRIAISKNRLYVAAPGNGLLIYDLSKPSAPRRIGRMETKSPCIDVVASGTRVCLLVKGALLTIDARHPAELVVRGRVAIATIPPDKGDEDGRYAKHVISADQYLLHDGSTVFALQGEYKIQIGYDIWWRCTAIDVSDLSSPRILKKFDAKRDIAVKAVTKGPDRHYLSLPVYHAYHSTNFTQCQIFDVTDPKNPLPMGCYNQFSPDCFCDQDNMDEIAQKPLYTPVLGQGMLFVPTGQDGLVVLK